MIQLINDDNIKVMQRIDNKFFDWGVIDPPYGLGKRLSDGGGKLKNTPMAALYRNKDWDVLPTKEFWFEFNRITKNQIIFGANYFLDYLPPTRAFVVWDKLNYLTTLSACELIYTSLDKPAKIYRESSMDLQRFHPTQKPVGLYKFMFNFCNLKEGDHIFDAFLGSGSSAIAAYDYNLNFTGCEIDKEYFLKASNRLENHKKQLTIKF